MRQWLSDHFLLLSVISGLTFVAGLIGAVSVAVALPADYFVKPPEHRHGKSLARKILKNAVGVIALLLGFVMALPLVPGPGLIIMLVGMSMTDFPGKRKLEIRLLHIPGLLKQLNGIRARCGCPPLALPDQDHSDVTPPSASHPASSEPRPVDRQTSGG